MESIHLTALSELDAVNNIIGTIGEAPVDSLENMTDVDAINALRILRDISRAEQARGWSFNIVPHFTLTPDRNTHKIKWNDNFLFVKGQDRKIIRQGDYVKDLFKDTLIFDSPIDIELVMYVPYEYLPEQFKKYILAKACFTFQSRYFGDDSLLKVTQTEISEAWQHLQEFEIDNNNFSMLENTYVQLLRMR